MKNLRFWKVLEGGGRGHDDDDDDELIHSELLAWQAGKRINRLSNQLIILITSHIITSTSIHSNSRARTPIARNSFGLEHCFAQSRAWLQQPVQDHDSRIDNRYRIRGLLSSLRSSSAAFAG